MSPELKDYILEAFSIVLMVFPILTLEFAFFEVFNSAKNKILNRKAGNDRRLDISLSVNDIYLIQRSLCFRAKVMDDYSSHKSYELIDKLTKDMVNNRVPVYLNKIGFRDFDDDI